MAIQVVNFYQMDTGKWYVQLMDEASGQRCELKYDKRPTAPFTQVKADANAIFNPPTVDLTNEDGTVTKVPYLKALDLSLTNPQKTAIANAENVLNTFADKISGKLPSDPDRLNQIRQHSPLLDGLISIADKVKA